MPWDLEIGSDQCIFPVQLPDHVFLLALTDIKRNEWIRCGTLRRTGVHLQKIGRGFKLRLVGFGELVVLELFARGLCGVWQLYVLAQAQSVKPCCTCFRSKKMRDALERGRFLWSRSA